MDLIFDDVPISVESEIVEVSVGTSSSNADTPPDLTNAAWLDDDGFVSNLGIRDLTHRFGILSQVLRAVMDEDGDLQEVIWVGNAVGGEVILGGEGQGDNVFFDATFGFNGQASFDYIVSDGSGEYARKTAVFHAQPTVMWSDLFAGVGQEEHVTIGPGQRVILDQDADVGSVVIDGGTLIVSDLQDIDLSTDWLLVMDGGEFRAGRAVEGYTHDFTLELTGDNPNQIIDLSPWSDNPNLQQITSQDSFLMAMGQDSVINIHGADAALESWSQLRETAEAGDDWLRLSETTGWQVGDVIAIASSEFSQDQAEQRVIVELANDGRDVRLDRALAYRHYGEQETYSNGQRSWTIDLRAEVGLLSRNVTITGDENAHLDGYGGHIMVMAGADMRISGTEITRMGQEGILGKYGAHWHLSGDATGDFLINNSFHEIYNKGIALHGVQNVVVDDNVVFGTIGHSIFTEDAAEFGNTIRGNLVLGTKAAESRETALTTADFDHVSSFWIENPNNIIQGNRAAGSEFAGFWIAPSDVHGLSKDTGLYETLTPRDDPIANFTGNSAHSNVINLGIEGHSTGQGSEQAQFHNTLYAPQGAWGVDDFTAYKSTDRSIWSRAHGGVFDDIKSADNTRATFFSHTSTLTDSLIVGRSNGNGDTTGGPVGHRGHSIYDGPSGIEGVHFANFTGGDHAIQVNGAAEKATTHFSSGLSFENVAQDNKVDFYGGAGSSDIDFVWATTLRDLDGSLTGFADATLTAKIRDGANANSKANVAPDAVAIDAWDAWLSQNAEIGWMRILPSHDAGAITDADVEATLYDIIRSDGEKILAARPTFDVLINPTVVIQDNLSYQIRFHDVPQTLSVTFRGLEAGSEVFYTYKGLPSQSAISGATEVVSLAALAGATTTSYFRDNSDFVFKVVADRVTYLTPTSDDPRALNRNFGSAFNIHTGQPDDSPNVVADFETGLDTRGTTSAVNVAVSAARAGWQDQVDSINWWDVVANGDGTLGYADYRFQLNGTEDWRAFASVSMFTLLSGVKAGYEVLLRDADDGLVSLGHQSDGLARIDLQTVADMYLDDVSEIIFRTHEDRLAADAFNSTASQRIHLHSIALENATAPRVADFDDGRDPKAGVAALNATVSAVRVGAGVHAYDVTTNGDGIAGFADFTLGLSGEDWQSQRWLAVDSVLSRPDVPYSVFIRDAQEGYIHVGDGAGGQTFFDLNGVDPTFLDTVTQVLIRVHEADLASDLAIAGTSVTVHIDSIDTFAGDVVVADFENWIDPRGRLNIVDAGARPIAFAGLGDHFNWWEVFADGNGTHGIGEYRLDVAQMDVTAFGELSVRGYVQGVDVPVDVLVRDLVEGETHIGTLQNLQGQIDLTGFAARDLDQVDQIIFRVHERDIQPNAALAQGASRLHLADLSLVG